LLPDVGAKRILQFGCVNPTIPLEMLRGGARQITVCEHDPSAAAYAMVNCRWYEFIDNHTYSNFSLIEIPPGGATDKDWTGYDMATLFSGPYLLESEQMATLIRSLSRTIDFVILQAGPRGNQWNGTLESLRGLLANNGYPDQKVLEFPCYTRPLILGRRPRT
jgi:hypothetical protein